MKSFAITIVAGLIASAPWSPVAAAAAARGLEGAVRMTAYQPHGPRICSPLMAVRKARALGLRDAEIAAITPRRVVVVGRNRHRPERIVFANLPQCPMLRR